MTRIVSHRGDPMAFQLEPHAHRSPTHFHESILLNSSLQRTGYKNRFSDYFILYCKCVIMWFLTSYTHLHLFSTFILIRVVVAPMIQLTKIIYLP